MDERMGTADVADDGVTDEMIARRAHELSESNEAGSPEENWFRAAAELRRAAAANGGPAASPHEMRARGVEPPRA